MSLTSYMADQFEAQAERWGRAIQTLPDRDLYEQRAELMRRIERVTGITPTGLVLKAIEAEIARRTEKRKG